jgi:phage replication-related protein YjqB (UPF0714/DUF867 family)
MAEMPTHSHYDANFTGSRVQALASAQLRPRASGDKLWGDRTPRENPIMTSYSSFAELSTHQVRGRDFEIDVIRRPASGIAVIAPHGGGIENGTSEIARAVATDRFNLYLFEGLRSSGNYAALHLTSHLFDEPECLALIASCPVVVAIHGCRGVEHEVLLGGRDRQLTDRLSEALRAANIASKTDGHPFPGAEPRNICNRGLTGQGVQLEITTALRTSPLALEMAAVVREALGQADGGR